MSTLRLNTGDLQMGISGTVLYTGGVGSCVVLCIWDRLLGIGGMAHVCMPAGMGHPDIPGRSPDTAVPTILEHLLDAGAIRGHLEVIIAGGGNMFDRVEAGSATDMGFHICASMRRVLKVHGLEVAHESIGGKHGRSVSFCLTSGQVDVRFTNGDHLVLKNGA